MAEYDYLEDLPESGGSGSGTLGTAAYRDVGTELDQLPDTEDVQSMIATGGAAAAGVLGVRFIESSGNYTLNASTSRLLLIIIGAGGGGEYGASSDWGYGGGAGGVTVGLVDVAGGSSQGVTVGAGGSGGTSTSASGGSGSPSSAGSLASTGGSGGDATSDGGGKGGLGDESISDGVLWSKRGGAGYGGYYYSAYDILDGGAGGNPWDTNTSGENRLWTDGAGFATETVSYDAGGGEYEDTKLNLWNTIFSGMTARYGYGGAGGTNDGAGGDGGAGLVIMVELA